MHKRFVNHCTIELILSPTTPILIKSGKEGADPTKPDMEFVETYHAGGKSIYLPGSSLKGAIRAHAERIVRTVGGDRNPNNPSKLWASNPLNRSSYDYLEPFQGDAPKIYQHSSFTDQLFGSTEIASRLRIEDAYPIDRAALRIEERNGVAIDRVFGSVAVGPFNFQVCTAGEFRTKIHLKNFSLEQLGLIGLVLRDLNDGWFGLGFAKSRGLGIVEARLEKAIVQYPGCILKDDNIVQVGREQSWSAATLIGAGAFLEDEEREKYGFASEDIQPVTLGIAEKMALGFGVQLTWENDAIEQVFEAAVKAWSKRLGVAA
ncbi:RAMP superfamily CRISPR-associated protein [Leptolyngbya sp. AN03gr2]|uniref:RAMP superfamily CRISPR-associated protein n=1 Tax=unclassified Leptolyngbya TaxID=2650499 RepID=UPI003D316362